jgi:CheY-like chemotaxis protein
MSIHAPTAPTGKLPIAAHLDFATVRKHLAGVRTLVLEAESEPFGYMFVSLSRAGCLATLARRWAQLEPAIGRTRPDLILFSTTLAEVRGDEIVHRLRDNPVTRTAILVAVAGHESKKERHRLIALGCDGYVWKPIDRYLFAMELVERTPRLLTLAH